MELCVAIGSGVAAGLVGTITCLQASCVGAVPPILYVGLLVKLRPHQRRIDAISSTANGVLLAFGAACTTLSNAFPPRSSASETSALIAAYCAIAASAAIFLPALYLPIRIARNLDLLRRRLEDAKVRRQQRRSAGLLAARASSGADARAAAVEPDTVKGSEE